MKLRFRRIVASLLVASASLLGISLVSPLGPAETAWAGNSGACEANGGTAHNDLKVYPSHGQVFYIDTGQGQEINAAYVGYRVENTSSATKANMWAKLDSFGGGVVSPASPSATKYRIGDIAASATEASFFLLQANQPTTVDQTHVVTIYNADPDLGGVSQYSCTFTFLEVKETIKAAANKVTSVAKTAIEELGGLLTITVEGETGTIGSGASSPDGEVLWFTPAARSSWPASSLVLESTQLDFYTSNGDNSPDTFNDTLIFRSPTTSIENNRTNRRYFYTATYRFRVRGPVSGEVQAVPVAQISSGTQIKHTDVSGIISDADSRFTLATPVNVNVQKDVLGAATDVGSDNKHEFEYTVTLQNTSSTSIALDQIVDDADSGLEFDSRVTAQFDGVNIQGPSTNSDGHLVFQGPFEIPFGASKTLTYTMVETAACSGTPSYTNYAWGLVGSQVVGAADAASIEGVTLSGSCGSFSAAPAPTRSLDPKAITQAAISVTATSATLNGSINPTGVDRTVQFEWGTAANLSSSTVVNLSNSGNGTSFSSVSTALSSLSPGTTYYFRVKIGSVEGEILSFTTAQAAADPVATTQAVSSLVPGTGSNGTVTLNGDFDANLVSGGAKAYFEWGLADNSGDSGTCVTPGTLTERVLQEDTDDNGSLDSDIVLTGGFPAALSLDIGSLTLNKYYCARAVIKWGSGPSVARGSFEVFQVSGSATISYNANSSTSGTVPPNATPSNGTSYTVASNSGTLERTGWTFAGWNTAANGSGTTYPVGSGSFTVAGSKVLYAKWTATVTYDANGGATPPTDGSAYTAADSVVVANNTGMSRTNFVFAEWNTEPNGSGTSYDPLDSLSIPATGNVTLYAQWVSQYTITFDGNTESSGSPPSAIVTGQGLTITIPTNSGSLQKTGFVFGGWSENSDGSGAQYAPGDSFAPTASTILYARWLIAYTISYAGNSSTSGTVPSPQTVGDGQTVTVASNSGSLTRSGFSFAGWQASPTGGPQYAAGSGSITVTGNVVLYARWTEVTSGGGNNGGSSETRRNNRVTPPATPPAVPPIPPRAIIPAAPLQAAGPAAESAIPDSPVAVTPNPNPPTPPGLSGNNAGNSGGGPSALQRILGGGTGTVDVGRGVEALTEVAGQTQGRTIAPTETAMRTPGQARQERLNGFTPGASTVVEIVGARSGARFVVADTEVVDRITLVQAINQSIGTQETDFFRIQQVQPIDTPLPVSEWDESERESVSALFDASGLAAPVNLSDLNVNQYSNWVFVESQASTYVPGSIVYLAVTSDPVVIGQAIVDQNGEALISGTFPAEILGAGEHRLRLVGIRALDGVFVDQEGAVEVTDELMAEIERFDLGTQSTIAIVGENTTGEIHTAVRVIPLVPQAPWWTLWIIAGAFLVFSAMRLAGVLRRPSAKGVGLALLVASAIPAVVLGWLSTVTAVVWWGLGLMLVAIAIFSVLPHRQQREQSGGDRPGEPRLA